ncbi:serine protease [Coelomomyces lativittatus]|nr:serine protease [Coelomomyces lativittatus]KAJ1514806.1 serine protease [Coelomomyces lativittatus]
MVVSSYWTSALSLPFSPLSTSSENRNGGFNYDTSFTSNKHQPSMSLPSSYGRYIVTFKSGLNVPQLKHAHRLKLLQLFQTNHLVFIQDEQGLPLVEDFHIDDDFQGYITVLHEEMVNSLLSMEEVDHVELDGVVHTYNDQMDAPWGLVRISHRDLPNGNDSVYHYPSNAGENVTIYIIDTGINIHHKDFEGRAKWGKTIPRNDEDIDGNGHGTHCAGIAGGKTYGVAKKATLVAVKVLSSNGAGSTSDVIKGVDWTVKNHKERVAKNKKAASVANMSLGGGYSKTLNRAVNAAVNNGVHFAVAAGNDDSNACSYSPASAKKAVTVGASTDQDDIARFSNHGRCVDVFAPGKDILSTWTGSNSATNIISGTSMASPHVAGAMGVLLSELLSQGETVSITPHDVKKALIHLSTLDHLHNLPNPSEGGGRHPPPFPFPFPPGDDDDDDEDEGETKNRLLYVGEITPSFSTSSSLVRDLNEERVDTKMESKKEEVHFESNTMNVIYRESKVVPFESTA